MNEAVNNFAAQTAEADKLAQQKLTEAFSSLVEPVHENGDELITKPEEEIKPEDLLEQL